MIRPDGHPYGRRLALVAALLVAVLVVACKGGDGGDDNGGSDGGGPLTIEEALKAMVLLEGDLPEGFLSGNATLSTNEQVALGNAERKQLIDSWGRLLGYDITYEPDAAALQQGNVRGINASSSLYESEEGAGASFADADASAEATDWASTNYAGLRDFQQEEIDASGRADEIGWLRFSGFQPATEPPDALVTDDLIYFRIGRERGFLRVLASSTETTDRSYLHDTVDGLLAALLQRVRDTLEKRGIEPSADGE